MARNRDPSTIVGGYETTSATPLALPAQAGFYLPTPECGVAFHRLGAMEFIACASLDVRRKKEREQKKCLLHTPGEPTCFFLHNNLNKTAAPGESMEDD